jgi:hypothetical protein
VALSGELSTMLGVMKSFQTHVVWKTPTVARIGRMSGSTMRQKIWNAPAPSMRAASMISIGMVRR